MSEIHKAIVHCGDGALKAISKSYCWKLVVKSDVYQDCAIGKAKQKKANKNWKQGSKSPAERLYIDISSVKGES